MHKERDYFQLDHKQTFEEATRTPSIDETLDEQWLQMQSAYPLRPLGTGIEAIKIREEDRSHIHLIGSTQEGKSKFIEFLIRGDIRRGIGFCLLDPTAGGKTVYDVLKWCAHKQLKKVCLIDPYHRFQYNKIPGLSPFLYLKSGEGTEKLRETSISDFGDTIRNFSGTKDFAETFRIERYLPAVLTALYDAKRPLSDAKYFTNRLYKDQREEILDQTDPDTALDLAEAFKTVTAFRDFQSTINRMQRFYKGTLGKMFSAPPINFMKLISEGWIILVNLDTGNGFSNPDSRLLGTFIINQIQVAIERLFSKKRENNPDAKGKPYYLYIDEASEYATRKLAKTLALKQKTGLKVTLAHQYTKQFEDPYIHSAIMANCKITAMFNITMAEDRDYISKQFYGGQILPEEASDANADLAKQHAVIKALKGKPRRVRVPDIKPPPVSAGELDSYIKQIYSQEWYHAANRKTTIHTHTFRPRTQANRRASSASRVSNNRSESDGFKTVPKNNGIS